MQLPGFAAKLLATERRLAGIAKASSARAISAAGDKAKAAAAALASALPQRASTRRLPLLGVAALALVLVLLFIALAIAAGTRGPKGEPLASEAISPAQVFADALIMPAPLPGELPFPLARERKSRYTESEVQNLRPDLGSLYLGDSVERRKAELEAIYNAVD
jgi:hypothetical protein